MMECPRCQIYYDTNHRGSKLCLNCQSYKAIKMASISRDKIPFDNLPDIIIEDVADTFHPQDTIQKLSKLPLRDALIILARIVLKASHRETAEVFNLHHTSIQKIMRTSAKTFKNL